MNKLKFDCGIFWRGDRPIGGCYNGEATIEVMPAGKQNGHAIHESRQSVEVTEWWFLKDEKNYRAKFYRVRNGELSKVIELAVAELPSGCELGKMMRQRIVIKPE